MAKVNEKSIEVFNKVIEPKVENKKYVALEKIKVTDKLKEFDFKMSHYRAENDYTMIASLKKEQGKLENEIVALHEQSEDDNHKLLDKDIKDFNSAYEKEVKELSDINSKLIQDFNNKLQDAYEVYEKIAANKVEAIRRASRRNYLNTAISNPDQWRLSLQRNTSLVDDPFRTNTDPRIIANKFEQKLFN
ncbi:M3 family metallopeptidase, partial [Staphylococcus saprophyticus]|uniref:M3 family metallopeptidase n=5 Tax=Staphylococcus TaxID=1279 RepID=UPI0011A64645